MVLSLEVQLGGGVIQLGGLAHRVTGLRSEISSTNGAGSMRSQPSVDTIRVENVVAFGD